MAFAIGRRSNDHRVRHVTCTAHVVVSGFEHVTVDKTQLFWRWLTSCPVTSSVNQNRPCSGFFHAWIIRCSFSIKNCSTCSLSSPSPCRWPEYGTCTHLGRNKMAALLQTTFSCMGSLDEQFYGHLPWPNTCKYATYGQIGCMAAI